MARCPAAGVVYHDEQLARFAADSTKGLCSMRIVKDPETKELFEEVDIDGITRIYEQTTQHHHVEVEYFNPEDEFEIRLSIDNSR